MPTVNHAYSAANSDELTLCCGDVVEVLERFDDGWVLCALTGSKSGVSGLYPQDYLTDAWNPFATLDSPDFADGQVSPSTPSSVSDDEQRRQTTPTRRSSKKYPAERAIMPITDGASINVGAPTNFFIEQGGDAKYVSANMKPAPTSRSSPSRVPLSIGAGFQLSGINETQLSGLGDLLETAVLLHRVEQKGGLPKGKIRHIFVFEKAVMVCKFKGRKYGFKHRIDLNAGAEVTDVPWTSLPSDEGQAVLLGDEGIMLRAVKGDDQIAHLFAAPEKGGSSITIARKVVKALRSRLNDIRAAVPAKKNFAELEREATEFLLSLQPRDGGSSDNTVEITEGDGMYDNITIQAKDLENGDSLITDENRRLRAELSDMRQELAAIQTRATDLYTLSTRQHRMLCAMQLEIAKLRNPVSTAVPSALSRSLGTAPRPTAVASLDPEHMDFFEMLAASRI